MADKLKPEFVSPGQAWMNHVEKNHNASAVTPAYLNQPNNSDIKDINQRLNELEKQNSQTDQDVPEKGAGVAKIQKRMKELQQQENQPEQEKVKMLEKEKVKTQKKEKDIELSR